jgi:hypothetical protein
MALETAGVCVAAGRNGHPLTLRLVAGRAVGFLNVRRVVKLRPEALHDRERFKFFRILLGMADHADRMRVIGKLRRVATGTGRVRRKFRGHRILGALMTEQAGNGFMARTFMLKLRKVDILHPVSNNHLFRQRLKRTFGRRFFLDLTRARREQVADDQAEKEQNNYLLQTSLRFARSHISFVLLVHFLKFIYLHPLRPSDANQGSVIGHTSGDI